MLQQPAANFRFSAQADTRCFVIDLQTEGIKSLIDLPSSISAKYRILKPMLPPGSRQHDFCIGGIHDLLQQLHFGRIQDHTVFTAKWLRSGNVTFLVDGKTYEVYQLNEGDTIKKPANPEKFGHKFVRWDPEVPAIMPDKDLKFDAVFEVDKDFVTLVIGGTVIAGGIIAAITGGGALAITGVSIIGGIIALIGGSSIIGKQYTVTYKVDGSVYKTYKVKAGASVPVPSTPKKNGYTFAGWTPEVPDKMPKNNLTFDAQWKAGSDEKIPDTGSGSVGMTAFAMLGLSSVLFAVLRKKKES